MAVPFFTQKLELESCLFSVIWIYLLFFWSRDLEKWKRIAATQTHLILVSKEGFL